MALFQWGCQQLHQPDYDNCPSELKFGDFDGDGGLQVVYWPGGLGSGVTLGHIPAPAPALRVGDFNGDGISDLMALRCGMNGPLAFAPIRTVAQSGHATFYRKQTGDVNGDGLADLILVSTCQNPNSFGTCASHHLQVGVALGAPAHTYSSGKPSGRRVVYTCSNQQTQRWSRIETNATALMPAPTGLL